MATPPRAPLMEEACGGHNPAAQSKVAASGSRLGRGPRSLFLRRCENGFGFTLRHFIVYPPESYSVLAGERSLGLRHGPGGRLDEPMDTIFVKHVREKSAAHVAGLATGDRIICVNGESVAGRSYAQVVQLIQQSGSYLHLLVVPREDDLLQLYFAETAHNPYTNPRPWEICQRDICPDQPIKARPSRHSSPSKPAMLTYPGSPAHRTAPRPSRRSSEGSVQCRTCGLGHSAPPLSFPACSERANSVERNEERRRDSCVSLPPNAGGTANSSPRLSIASSEADSVITRIKKSFEQKEEFLRRPNQPIWLPASSASSTSSNSSTNSSQTNNLIPREFYAHPQKFQKPLWPPPQQNGADTNGNDETEVDRSSVKAQFMCGGAVTNVAPPPRPAATDGTSLRPGRHTASPRSFVTTLSRITENQPTVQTVSLRARQFESGQLDEDKTVLYRSELARLSAKKSVPDVAHRKLEFESKALDSSGPRSPPPRAPAPSPPVSPPPPMFTALSGNRVIPVGGRYVASDQEDSGWLEDTEDEVTTPPAEAARLVETWAPALQRHGTLPRDKRHAIAAGSLERPTRPTHLSLQNPVRPPSPPPASTAEESLPGPGAEPPEAAHTTTGDVTALLAGVQMRRPPRHSLEVEAERSVRRESYLKATWAERMQGAGVEPESPGSPPEEPPAAEEPEEILREGHLHCKLSLQDGKRATDRSWKQVWAMLRGNTLYLRKERRDNAGHHGNAAGSAEEQAVPLRGCLVDAASDYTKKKHVLRLHTPAGSQLLLQAEDPLDMARWLQLLRPRAQEGSSEDVSSPQPAHKGGIRKLTTSFRNRSPTGQSPVNKTRKPSQLEPLASPKSKTWKGRVARQLRKIQGSPSSPTTAHPQGVTIGVPLEDCPQSSFCEFVPLLVELCTGIVEERGLEVIGIYRVPGNTAAVTSLTEGVNKGFDGINLQDPRWNDVNVISSLLKSFFRKLPDSLFTSELYPLFIAADKLEDAGARFRRIRTLVHELPEHHLETLRCLMAHLNKVVQHCATNKMEARNLAIVFGPTLVRTSDDNMVAMVTDMPHQCRIVESLISHAAWFFCDEEGGEELPAGLPGEATAESTAADAANHSLLLNNIHKVEGYKGSDSPSKEISAKDIVSSIISAANKKMHKAKTRRGLRLHSEDSADSRDDEKVGAAERSKPVTEAASEPAPGIASSILGSVLFSGGLVKNLAAAEGGATIHSYAGLSASTQERIRRFEQETRAMLTRDPTKREGEEELSPKLSGKPPLTASEVSPKLSGKLPPTTAEVSPKLSGKLPLTASEVSPKLSGKPPPSAEEVSPKLSGKLPPTTSEVSQKLSGKSPLTASEFSPRMSGKPPPSAAEHSPKLSGKAPPSAPHATAQAVLSSLRAIRRGTSVENVAEESPSFDTQKVAPNGTLKRLKTGKGEPTLGPLRCGSLDSLHDALERPASQLSDDGADLLASLTSTFDQKMRSLTEGRAASGETTPDCEQRLFRDPSLHRAPIQDAAEQDKVTVRVRDATARGRLSKGEKTSPTSLLLARLKRKSAAHLQRGVKRRHTVGGTKDLARLGWVPDGQQQAVLRAWLRGGRLRSSSPELSTAVLLELRKPLESHV